ncbi:hypothetical protein ACIOD2_47365 [Amycolatopsis sp. NPDC088138]|uniref:hypothetical protein n=1 Tax=Amycolatopsis sp. NPDC088138 TaxID=3363938 RepID=UPI003805C306
MHDAAAEHLGDTARAALALLATDDPSQIDTVIRYVVENTYPAPDPQTLRDIRARHRTLADSPAAPAADGDSEEADDE